MSIGGFLDQALSSGDFAVEWTSLRFFITPTQGIFAQQQLPLEGVWDMSGEGFVREGVTLIWPADGSGVARKGTTGREKPNEITLVLDPLTAENYVKKAICPPKNRARKFNFLVQVVDPSGAATYSRQYTGCLVTGLDFDTPSDGTPHKASLKFQPTARAA